MLRDWRWSRQPRCFEQLRQAGRWSRPGQGAGARVVAAGSIIDRSGGTAEVGVPRIALAVMQVEAYAPEECPLCRAGQPLVKPGSRPVHAAH